MRVSYRGGLKSGFTLTEVMVAAGIVLVLIAALGLALAPSAKKKALETRVRSDLRQVVSAISIYMADNGDQYPLGMYSLPASVPTGIADWDTHHRQYGSLGKATYFFTYPWHTRARESRYPTQVRFDPDIYAIVDAPFIARNWDLKRTVMMRQPDGSYHQEALAYNEVLGAWLDGHIAWKPFFDDWEADSASINMLPL